MAQAEHIINREDLYEILREYCGDDYVIGMHGIATYNLTEQGDKVEEQRNSTMQNIMENGLDIRSGRRLVGTVAFADPNLMTEKDFVNSYRYGDSKAYAIIAMPKTLKNKDGEGIYIGSPLYNWNGGGGYETTCLSDILLPDYQQNDSKLDSMFVLGTFSFQDDGKIKLISNPEHIAFHEGIVPNDFFEIRKQRLLHSGQILDTKDFIVGETSLEQLKRDFILTDKYSKHCDYICYNDLDEKIYEQIEDRGDFSCIPEDLKAFYEKALGDEEVDEAYYITPYAYKRTMLQFAKEYYDFDLESLLLGIEYDFEQGTGVLDDKKSTGKIDILQDAIQTTEESTRIGEINEQIIGIKDRVQNKTQDKEQQDKGEDRI